MKAEQVALLSFDEILRTPMCARGTNAFNGGKGDGVCGCAQLHKYDLSEEQRERLRKYWEEE